MKSVVFAVAASLFALVVSPRVAPAAETFTYRLLPGKNLLMHTILSAEGNQQLIASVGGSFQFTLHDDNSITTTAFDLTIEGPILNDVLEPVADAPFAPGDNLAHYLVVDFAATGGFAYGAPPLSSAPPQHQAWVGPDATRDGSAISVGLSHYHLGPLELVQNVFSLDALALPELGGAFRILPKDQTAPTRPVVPIDPGQFFPIDVLPTLVLLGPNVERVPEPAAATLLLAGIACLVRRRRR
jgi:hypothetical protein